MIVHKTISIRSELLQELEETGRREGIPSNEVFEYFLQGGIARIKEFEARRTDILEHYVTAKVVET